jgi:hypothetical protein
MRDKKYIQILVQEVAGNKHLGRGGRIVLKIVLKRQGRWVWNAFMWFMTQSTGGPV